MEGRRIQVERPVHKDVKLTDLPAISLDGKGSPCKSIAEQTHITLELPPDNNLRGRPKVETPSGRETTNPVFDSSAADLREACASMRYKITKVPSCLVAQDGIPGSVVYPVLQRSQWEAQTNELLALCHEAAERRANKTGAFRGIHHDHAEAERMSLAFIQDRIDTDDPIRGYTVRTCDRQRRLQGFIWFTTFTTWTHFFKWDSKSPEAGLRGSADRHGIRWDSDNSLAWELEQQERAGDPRAEGVIWPRVGEVSLVGGLGCGGFLLQLALEEMEARGTYDYAVVQATESSAGFYDRMGFVRVGALARYVISGSDYRRVETVAYRHFAGPDEDVTPLDSSIMMAIRLRPIVMPRRVLFKEGGIYNNLGRRVAVCLEHASEADHSVKSTVPNSPEDRDRDEKESKELHGAGGKLIGSPFVVGPNADELLLKELQHVIVMPEVDEAVHRNERKVVGEAAGEGARELRRAGHFAKRRLSLWLSPKEANRSWELYGTPPKVDEAAERGGEGCGSGLGRADGGRRTGRGRGHGRRIAGNAGDPGVRRYSAAARQIRDDWGWEDSPGRMSTKETPGRGRKRKTADRDESKAGIGLRLLESLRKETLRIVCSDFSEQISGPKGVLISRVEKVQQEMLKAGRAWLDHYQLRVPTLELICADLGLYKRGTKEDLRVRIFEFGEQLDVATDESALLCLEEEPGANYDGEKMGGEEMSLQALRRDTLRLVCFDLDLPFSGPKQVLIPRILRRCEVLREENGVESREGDDSDVSGWWLSQANVKQATLQSACMDLGVNKCGSKPDLRHRILASTGRLLVAEEEEVQEDPTPSTALVHGADSKPRERGRPRKKTQPLMEDEEMLCAQCTHSRTPPLESPWDVVQCQRCGETEPEGTMILCDDCDGGYHYDTCAYPRLYAIPRGPWICYDCVKRRKKEERAEALEKEKEKGGKLLGISRAALGLAASGRERKATQRFRPHLGI